MIIRQEVFARRSGRPWCTLLEMRRIQHNPVERRGRRRHFRRLIFRASPLEFHEATETGCWWRTNGRIFLPARRYAIARYLPSSCVCPSVCLSQVGVLLRRLDVGSRKQRHTVAQELVFWCQKISANQRSRQIEVGQVQTTIPDMSGTADRLRRCQLSSPVSAINVWWSSVNCWSHKPSKTDRQTDQWPRYSVCSNGLHLAIILRCGPKRNQTTEQESVPWFATRTWYLKDLAKVVGSTSSEELFWGFWSTRRKINAILLGKNKRSFYFHAKTRYSRA